MRKSTVTLANNKLRSALPQWKELSEGTHFVQTDTAGVCVANIFDGEVTLLSLEDDRMAFWLKRKFGEVPNLIEVLDVTVTIK